VRTTLRAFRFGSSAGALRGAPRALWPWVFALAWLAATQPEASAQSRGGRRPNDRQAAQQNERSRDRGRDSQAARRDGPSHSSQRPRATFSPFDGNPFLPLPQELGPPSAEEAHELMFFARQRVRTVFDALDDLRRNAPGAFRGRLREMAPRLRMLRRLFDEDPRVAEAVVTHITNMEAIQRARRAWGASGSNPTRRQRIAAEVRRRAAENLRIERQVLLRRAERLEQERERLVQEEIERLTADDADLWAEPPPLRDLAEDVRQAASEREHDPALAALRAALEERLEHLTQRLRFRAEDITRNARGEIDRRLADLFHEGPQREGDQREGDQPRAAPNRQP